MTIRRRWSRLKAGRATFTAGAVALCVLWAAAGCLERDGTCHSDTECPGGSRCVDGACGLPPTDHSPSEGCGDALEPNDTAAAAPLLGPGEYGGLRLCAGEDDWLGVELGLDDRLRVRLRGEADAGDLDLSVYSPAGALLATSDGRSASEEIGELRARSPGRYLIRVFGFQGGAGAYRVEIDVSEGDCTRSEPLPAERAGEAAALGEARQLTLGAGEERFFRVLLGAGESLRVAAVPQPEDAALELGLYRLDQQLLRPLLFGESRTLSYGPASATEAALLRVVNRTDVAVRVDLDGQVSLSSMRWEGRIQGTVSFEDRPATAAGLGPAAPAPVALARVEVYRPSDGYVVASGLTDAAGRYDLSYVTYAAGALAARVLARRDDSFARLEVQRDQRCRETYAVRAGAQVDPASEAAAELDILAVAGGAGGAFNVFATLGEAFEFLRALGYPPAARKLVAYWERGVRHGCGSCYDETGDHILVGGGPADPDEYDDPVLLHEFGHYYEVVFSRTDSPGGPHDGSPTDPALAWSEGFATYFAAALRGDPLYVDTVGPDTWSESIEDFVGLGTAGQDLDGDVSENLVSGVLWDLQDDSPGESFDRLARPPEDVLFPTSAYFPGPSYLDRGGDGVDLVDYLDGWSCLGLGGDAELTTLLGAHRFPYTGGGPADCRQKPRPPLHLELSATPSGPGGLVRLSARVSATAVGSGLRLRLRLPPGWTLVRGAREKLRRSLVWPGDEAELVAWVRPAAEGSAVVSGAVFGPGARVRAASRAWPPPTSPPRRGTRAISGRGRLLRVFGGLR